MKLFLFPLFILFSLNFDSANELAAFNIEMKRSGNLVKMKCNEGCNWTDLKFSLGEDQTWVINEFGVHIKSGYHHEDEISFAFEVMNAKDGLKFESIKGTAWKELKYGIKPSRLMYLNSTGVSREKR